MKRLEFDGREPNVTTKSVLQRPDAHEFIAESCHETMGVVRQSLLWLQAGRWLMWVGRLWARASRPAG